jgi:hypothetical protein
LTHWRDKAILRAERERLLDALDRLPRTICRLDAFLSNLFSLKR